MDADCQSNPYLVSSYPINQCMGRFNTSISGEVRTCNINNTDSRNESSCFKIMFSYNPFNAPFLLGSTIKVTNYRQSNCSAGVEGTYTYDSGVCSSYMRAAGKVSYTYGDPLAPTGSPTPSPSGPPVTSSPPTTPNIPDVSVSPSISPVTPFQASSTSASSTSACFSGSETVRMESGEVKLISLVMIGDRVQTSDVWGEIEYSEVTAVVDWT